MLGFGILAALWRLLFPDREIQPLPKLECKEEEVGEGTTVVEQQQPAPNLHTLPHELLQHITRLLSPESAAALRLTSKHHYAALQDDVDLTLADYATRGRFLRLLELDLPEYMACHGCHLLFRWTTCRRKYECPLRFDRGMYDYHMSGIEYCHTHLPWNNLYRETVAAFLRGYERGPEHGPQLDELRHQCDGWSCYKSRHVSRDTEAKVVGGKLLLRTIYEYTFFKDPEAHHSLVYELEKFQSIGCRDSYETLPALVLDVIRGDGGDGTSASTPRHAGYIRCVVCATDLRVHLMAKSPENTTVRICMWHCFGSRDFQQEDRFVQAMFKHPMSVDYSNLPGTRNLELLYNSDLDGGEGGGGDYQHLSTTSERQSLLQWWKWESVRRFETPRFRYVGPAH
jgi:hypothetical protein